jgi:hypothetical protein
MKISINFPQEPPLLRSSMLCFVSNLELLCCHELLLLPEKGLRFAILREIKQLFRPLPSSFFVLQIVNELFSKASSINFYVCEICWNLLGFESELNDFVMKEGWGRG